MAAMVPFRVEVRWIGWKSVLATTPLIPAPVMIKSSALPGPLYFSSLV
jgi:hypothetical protein